LGVALSESGVYATIYYPRVEEYAKERIATHSQILGHAIAHEMGHLLLGPVPHARFGIMRGEWKVGTCRVLRWALFYSARTLSALIRQAAMRRMRGQKNPALE
jgi:hypothetical protein